MSKECCCFRVVANILEVRSSYISEPPPPGGVFILVIGNLNFSEIYFLTVLLKEMPNCSPEFTLIPSSLEKFTHVPMLPLI